ncbi:hypothetical protein [Roseateles oligotrophus]|uniref:Uncharacterized protein n=1 Tax=Roseateles oligotrophus TaxID=1769250 RepID=A0ABT2YDZ5_9BURK|nr:hypothetical protein [Roseateles oligotrophus]MCV2368215.1 hypothetical protein [Roseateles oligotrophus]
MINIIFTDLSRCKDARNYVRQKLTAAFEGLPTADLERLTSAACAPGHSAALPLLPREGQQRLTEAQQRSVARKVRLFTAAVDRLSPLLDDETRRADDFCTYLAHDSGHYPKGTPVLVRDTSQATICYVFEKASVDAGTGAVSYHTMPMLMATLDQTPEVERHVSSWMQANFASATAPSAEQVLGGLAKGLVGLLPGAYGKIGAALLGFLIPSGGGIDYKQLLDDFGTIIRDANRRQTLSEQGGVLNGVVGYINGNYAPQRDSGRSSKAELFALLNPQLADIYKVIGVLKQPEFEQGGISTFVSAVTHKYLVYQEMALQDPSVKHPMASSKAISISHDAVEDVRHATRVLDALLTQADADLAAWIGQISGIKIRITDCPKSEWFFEDYKSGYHSQYFQQSGCKDDPHARAEAARADYIATVRRNFRAQHQDQLPWMREVVQQWQTMIEQPLPLK